MTLGCFIVQRKMKNDWLDHCSSRQPRTDISAKVANSIRLNTCRYIWLSPRLHRKIVLQIVPRKLQSAFEYRLRKNPAWKLRNQTRLLNYDYLSTIQWRPHLIWPGSHKEIWIFVKKSHWSLSTKFCHMNVHCKKKIRINYSMKLRKKLP